MKKLIRFDKLRILAAVISISLIIAGIWFFSGLKIDAGMFTPKGLNLGIDFQGGLVHQLTVYSGIDQDEIKSQDKMRAFAIESGLGSEVQKIMISDKKRIGKAESYLIKTIISKEDQNEIDNDSDMTPAKFLGNKTAKLHSLIKAEYGETYILKGSELSKANAISKEDIAGEIIEEKTNEQRVLQNVVKESENVISPAYSVGLRTQSIILVLFVLFAMLLYISFRFKFKFAIGAVAALIHDVVITIGIISMLQLEFDYTIIAAILFIIGYSLNDTIVIFDRIRENYSILNEASSREVINTSINQSLSRTIITSLTTLLAVLALYFWGGSKVSGFSLTLIIGILCGTYSSIFIASPVVDSWEKIFAEKKTKLKEQKKEEKMIEKEQNPVNHDENKPAEQSEPAQISLSKKQMMKLAGKKKKK